MATLEKIRSKSVLLFTIIIVALLAFILGDFLTSGRSYFGPGDTVASADGAKVSFNNYQERLSQNSDNQKNQGQSVDNDVLGQQTIEELMLEALLDKEYDRMGIDVTDKQLADLMVSGPASTQIFQNMMGQFGQGAQLLVQNGIVDMRTYYDAMKNPAKYKLQPEDGQAMSQVWSTTEKNLDQALRGQAYGVLIQGLFAANKVDAQAMYNDVNTTSHFAYVRQDLSAVADKDVKLTDEDYQKQYDRHKGMFKLQEEQRAVDYIIVPIVPSDADYAAGQKEVEDVIVALRNSEGTAALAQHSDFVAQNGKYTKAALARDPQLRALSTDSTGIVAGTVALTQNVGGNYVIAKVLETTTGMDNVKFSILPALASDMDSIRATLTVSTFDSIARLNGGSADLTTSLVTPRFNLTEEMTEALTTKPVGEIFFLTDTIQSQGQDGKPVEQILSTAYLISERDAAVPVYDLAKITYSVVPSTETVKNLNSKFHAFVGNNATAQAFKDNAEKEGYTVNSVLVSNSTPLVGNAPQSRSAVKWAMKNKKGKVSPVFNQNSNGNDYLMAVAVNDVYDGKYIPVSAQVVRDYLKTFATADKKAEMLIGKLSGVKDLNGYSAKMGSPVAQADAVFAEDQIPAVGYAESVLQGVVAGSPKGKVSAPFRSNNAIYVVSVEDVKTEGRPYNFQESAATFGQKFITPIMQNPLQLLLGDKKMKNNILEFTPDQVN